MLGQCYLYVFFDQEATNFENYRQFQAAKCFHQGIHHKSEQLERVQKTESTSAQVKMENHEFF